MCGCADKETELLLEEEQEELSAQAEETADKEQEKDLRFPRGSCYGETVFCAHTAAGGNLRGVCAEAVVQPGVYAMKSDSRVFQAIEAAGGFLPDAAGTSINQACALSDGQQIYVPTKEEAEKGMAGQPSGGAADPGTGGAVTEAAGTGETQDSGTRKSEHSRFCSASDTARYRRSQGPGHSGLPGGKGRLFRYGGADERAGDQGKYLFKDKRQDCSRIRRL